jgi:Zn-dependent protease with chaperone function
MRAFLTRTKLPIPTEFSEIASRMHIKIRSFGIVEGRTAYVAFGSLVFGKDLIRDLSPQELLAVIAHEFGHIKGRDGLKRSLLLVPLMLFALYSWSKLNSPIFYSEAFTAVMLSAMMLVALTAYMTVMMVPVNWNLEYHADETAAKFAKKENIESALLKIAKAEKRDLEAQSETHPSINERIDRLEKLGHQQRSGRLMHIFKGIFSFGLFQ